MRHEPNQILVRNVSENPERLVLVILEIANIIKGAAVTATCAHLRSGCHRESIDHKAGSVADRGRGC
jgi:hypothetical protein